MNKYLELDKDGKYITSEGEELDFNDVAKEGTLIPTATRYWVFFVGFDGKSPWLTAVADSFATLDEAITEIDFKKAAYPITTAWVTAGEGENAPVVYHRCFVR